MGQFIQCIRLTEELRWSSTETGEHTGLHEICLFMEELADVVKIFHDTGFLHLDISPDNILIIPMPGENEIPASSD